MSPQQYTNSHTNREHNTWLAWLDLHHNPDLVHYYLAQVACEARRVMSSKPNDVLIEHFYLKLIKSKVDGVELTEEELKAKTELSKAIWVGGVGGLDKVEQRTVSRSDLDDEYEDHECPLPEN